MSPFADILPIGPMASETIVRTPKDIGALIRSARRDRGLDQGALAALVGVSRQWISEIENGKSSAELGLMLRTLNALRVTLTARAQSQALPSHDPLSDLLKTRGAK